MKNYMLSNQLIVNMRPFQVGDPSPSIESDLSFHSSDNSSKNVICIIFTKKFIFFTKKAIDLVDKFNYRFLFVMYLIFMFILKQM